MSKELDAQLAALIERCDETDRLIIDTRRFADLEDENAKLREQGERLFDKTLELATENVRLQDENARLRSCLSDDAENARMIMAENEKLRELCKSIHHFVYECQLGCEQYLGGDERCDKSREACWMVRKMRELGIEVVE